MWCPKCSHEKTFVSDTKKGIINERYRRCEQCGYTFITIEVLKLDSFWIEYAKHIIEIESSPVIKQKVKKALKDVGIDYKQGSLFDEKI